MRAVTRPSIRASIDGVLRRAYDEGRQVEQIVLDPFEWLCFVAEFRVPPLPEMQRWEIAWMPPASPVSSSEEGVPFDRALQPWRIEVVPEGSIHERHF